MATALRTKHIDELHFEHELWQNEISFYKDELIIYVKRLAEVASKNSSEEVRKDVEHFQNQFVIQKEQLDILHHQINEHDQWLARFASEHPAGIEKELFANHAEMIDKFETFKKIYADLKVQFTRFLGAWL